MVFKQFISPTVESPLETLIIVSLGQRLFYETEPNENIWKFKDKDTADKFRIAFESVGITVPKNYDRELAQYCGYWIGFIPHKTRQSPIGLYQLNGWNILEAVMDPHPFVDGIFWTERVVAVKNGRVVNIALNDELRGDREYLLDFLHTYRRRIEMEEKDPWMNLRDDL
jgi:hypothetical protein